MEQIVIYNINLVYRGLADPHAYIDRLNHHELLMFLCGPTWLKSESERILLLKRIDSGTWYKGFCLAFENGLLRIVEMMAEKDQCTWWTMFKSLCCTGHISSVRVVSKYLKHKFNDDGFWDYGLYGACKGGRMRIAKLMINKGADAWSNALENACEGGNMEIVELLMSKGATDGGSAFSSACRGGNIKIVELLISRGANWWNYGLLHACKGGHLPIIKLMINKGATDMCKMMSIVCEQGDPTIVDYFLNSYEVDFNHGLRGACRGRHPRIVDLMLTKGATDWYGALYDSLSIYDEYYGRCEHNKHNLALIESMQEKCLSSDTLTFTITRSFRYSQGTDADTAYYIVNHVFKDVLFEPELISQAPELMGKMMLQHNHVLNTRVGK
jgi:Ankyrin repeats (3 copies)